MISSCEERAPNETLLAEEDQAIESAAYWIENNDLYLLEFSNSNSKNLRIQYEPVWNNYFFNKFEDFFTIELNLKTKGVFGFAFEDAIKAYSSTNDERYLRTLTRLVIQISNDYKETFGFFMTFVPGNEYRENYNFGKLNSTYLNIDSKFSGYILYHNTDGSFANGWKYEDGEITKSVSLSTYKELPEASKLELACEDVYAEVWYQDCTDWWQVTDETWYFIGTSCGAPYAEMEYLYTECTESYASGGGYDPDPQEGGTPTDYVAQSGDVFAKSSMSQTMFPQVLYTCVTSIMEYINNEFCEDNIDENYYIQDYHDTYGDWVPLSGVTGTNIGPFVRSHFEVTLFNTFQDAINSNQVVMTNIPAEGDGVHNVLVVGYHQDGSLIYMDPMTGTLQEADYPNPAHFLQNYILPINGCL